MYSCTMIVGGDNYHFIELCKDCLVLKMMSNSKRVSLASLVASVRKAKSFAISDFVNLKIQVAFFHNTFL